MCTCNIPSPHLSVVLLVPADDDGDRPRPARHHPLHVAGGQVGGVATPPVRQLGAELGVQLLGQDAFTLGV